MLQTHKIYFAGSITAGRGDQPIYEQIVDELRKYGTISTELIGSPNLLSAGETMSDSDIHDRDVAWLMASDCLVAEVTNPSLGVGYEIALATQANIPVLCLYRAVPERRLSAMIAGCKLVQVNRYSDIGEVPTLLAEFFASLDVISNNSLIGKA
ncbi:nucleoside 2-deoxyribosyltransferase [soil metagenome]